MNALLLGLTAGSLHVLAGPDHLAALAPMAVVDRKEATGLGFRWGLGHGVGAVALGLLGMAARGLVDVDAWSAWAEFSVGFVLVAVGVWSFRRASKLVVHEHEHEHQEESEHRHVHVHDGRRPHVPEAHVAHTHAAFAVGALHGAAGTGHLLAVLPAMAFSTTSAAMYLAAYFIAAVASMTLFASGLGVLAKRSSWLPLRPLAMSASALAMMVGVWWIGTTWPG